MKKIYVAMILAGSIQANYAQNVGIGTNNPQATLDVNGTIKVGNTANTTPVKGAIRWNDNKNDFEGYNGTAWVSLTGGQSSWGNQQSYATQSGSLNQALEEYSVVVAGHEFGYSIAALGDRMVVGARRDINTNYNEDEPDLGSIRVYKLQEGKWNPISEAGPPYLTYILDSADYFGTSVAISSTHIVGGAPGTDLLNAIDAGRAYVFSYTDNAWIVHDTLQASDAQAGDLFGSAVAIDGDYAAVGAPDNDVSVFANMGRAYVFRNNGQQWVQHAVFTPLDGATGDKFGSSVAFWNGYLAIGAPRKTIDGKALAGKVYLYRQNGLAWGLIGELNAPEVKASENFGKALSLRDNKLIIGAPSGFGIPSATQGSIYIYDLNGNNVSFDTTITPSVGEVGGKFGYSVSYAENVLMVGAPNVSVNTTLQQGLAFAYKNINGQWHEQAVLKASADEGYMSFGFAVALANGYGIVTAPFNDFANHEDNGQVFFFKR